MEVEAVDEGVLGKIVVVAGTENVAVNSLIALILEDGEDKKALEGYKSAAAAAPKEAISEATPEKAAQNSAAQTQFSAPPSFATPAAPSYSAPVSQKSAANGKASPLAKRVAADNGLDVAKIGFGSGPNGRIVKDDVLDFLDSKAGSVGFVRRNPEEITAIKNNNMRKVIAKRLLESKQFVPHFYLSADLNIDKLLEMRETINGAATNVHGKPSYKVSVNDLVIKAVALALKKVPQANSSWSDDAILLYNNIDISVAVAIDGGLITPIVRNADQKSIVEISKEMKELAKKAKEGRLQPEEFQGGGFSISNLGMYGVNNFNAIVNPPQSCILAVGAGIEKPIVQNGAIKIATIMNVTLSSDHRSVDGAVGAEFLKALKSYIENPVLMLI